jgi:hypothetical protein
MALKPVSSLGQQNATPHARAAAAQQPALKTLLKMAGTSPQPGAGPRLADIVNDTVLLTKLIRIAGLSDDVAALLAHHHMKPVTHLGQLPPHVMDEMLDLLASAAPHINRELAEIDHAAASPQPRARPAEAPPPDPAGTPDHLSAAQFTPFTPGPVDFENTIDSLQEGSAASHPQDPRAASAFSNQPGDLGHGVMPGASLLLLGVLVLGAGLLVVFLLS